MPCGLKSAMAVATGLRVLNQRAGSAILLGACSCAGRARQVARVAKGSGL